jgi:hypothetical protein
MQTGCRFFNQHTPCMYDSLHFKNAISKKAASKTARTDSSAMRNRAYRTAAPPLIYSVTIQNLDPLPLESLDYAVEVLGGASFEPELRLFSRDDVDLRFTHVVVRE